MWPSSSTPKNSISNIKTNIQKKNQIWVRIPKVMRKIPGRTRLHLLLSYSFVLSPKESSEFLPILPCVLPPKKNPLISFPFLLYIYHPSRPKFLSKKENSPIFFLLFFSFFKIFLKSNLPHFEFSSKNFRGGSHLP